MTNHHDLANFIWSIADLLRGPYRPPQYERVMLPLTVLRRFDCVLATTKDDVLAAHARLKDKHQGEALDLLLNKVAGQRFHNHSPLTFEKLKGDPDNIHQHLVSYIQGFSENVRKIFERFEFANEIERMREHNILYLVVTRFCDVELHPRRIDNMQMGLLFEDLIRRFNEQANETAGDHFTPREVIRLMVNLLFMHDDDLLTKPGTLRKLLDPTCGTGGMLSEARKYLREHNLTAKLYVYGQDFNPRSYAVAASDLLLKEGPEERERTSRIEFGDSLVDDHFPSYDADTKGRFDYFLANPPFGVDWKRQQKEIVREHEKLGFAGRFGAGLPRVNDGALLFLQHMVSKFEPVNPKENRDGSRLAIVFNGSPLFTGGAGSGESEIRRWIIENDWLEAIVALPEQMFYNTGIGTYIWVVTNRKEPRRKGKIQLLDARECWVPLRRSLGDKRRKLAGGEEEDNEKVFFPDGSRRDDIAFLTRAYGGFAESRMLLAYDAEGKLQSRLLLGPNQTLPANHGGRQEERDISKIFDNPDFGYHRLTIERPLRLLFQITLERKEAFLDACPHLLDNFKAIEAVLGRNPNPDWNAVWGNVQKWFKRQEVKWRVSEHKAFRTAFTETEPTAEAVILRKHGGKIEYEPDPKLRDFENVPLKVDVAEYFKREVLPHVPDAWIDHDKTKIGYEINFNRHFYRYDPPRLLAEIDADLKIAEEEIVRLLREVTA
jgi:type I restriction enzyme M protein